MIMAFSRRNFRLPKIWIGIGFLWLGILACTLSPIREPRLVYITATPLPITPMVPTGTFPPQPTPTRFVIPTAQVTIPAGYTDATQLLNDVCFDALLPIIGNYFMLDSQAALDQFWGTLNVASVCGRTVRQPTYDFSGQVVVGMVRLAEGCTANFIPEAIQQNDGTQQVVIPLRFEVNEACDYQLAVSFVVGIPRPPSGYSVSINITE